MATPIGTPVTGTSSSPGNVTVPSGADLAVLWVWNNGPAATAASLGAAGMTLIGDAETFFRSVAAFLLVSPASGTPTLNITVLDEYLFRFRLEFYEDVDLTTPIVEINSAFDNDTDFDGTTFNFATEVGDLVRVAGIVFSTTEMVEVGLTDISTDVTSGENVSRHLGGAAGDADGVTAGYEVTTEANWALLGFVIANASGGVTHDLAAAVSASASVVAALRRGDNLDADVAVSLVLQSALSAGANLSTSVAVAGFLTAALRPGVNLQALLTASGALTAQLQAGANLASGLVFAATVEGGLQAGVNLAADALAQASVDTDLDSVIQIAASVQNSVMLDADLASGTDLSATVIGSAVVLAGLAGGVNLNAAVVATNAVSAGLLTGSILGAGIEASAVLEAPLTVDPDLLAAALQAGTVVVADLQTIKLLQAALNVTGTVAADLEAIAQAFNWAGDGRNGTLFVVASEYYLFRLASRDTGFVTE